MLPKSLRITAVLAFILSVLVVTDARAQGKAPPKHEFRGAWMASVANLDWPKSRTASTSRQKKNLRQMLDRMKSAGINAVVFQVRTEGDALYESELEPWSYWLTGKQGQAPEPFYDPLRFAIREAHERGMELHAWFNPYRAVDAGSSYEQAAGHVTQEHPEWILTFDNGLKILNPGLPQVRDYVTRVIMDVTRRYDIDGVHFDDYFYPYFPHIQSEDAQTFSNYQRGYSDVGNWRRDNVNRFIGQVHDSLNAVKPQVKFGVSPFGIWKSGVPSGICGLSAFSAIYADAVTWMQRQDLDYLSPQLYWGIGERSSCGSVDYATLAPWWASKRNGRHLYPGIAAYKASSATFANELYAATQIPQQLRFNRDHSGLQGNILFRAENLTRFQTKGLADSLQSRLYRFPALTPTMAWKDTTAPAPPPGLADEWTGEDEETVRLSWTAPDAVAQADAAAAPERYAVYRVRTAETINRDALMQDARNLLAVTGRTTYEDRPAQADAPYHYFVTAVSRNAVESTPSEAVQVEGRRVDAERPPPAPAAFTLEGNAPNPFRDDTTIRFRLERPMAVTLSVYDALGRRVRSLADRRRYGTGWQAVRFEAEGLPGGTYFVVLEAGGRRATRALTLAR